VAEDGEHACEQSLRPLRRIGLQGGEVAHQRLRRGKAYGRDGVHGGLPFRAPGLCLPGGPLIAPAADQRFEVVAHLSDQLGVVDLVAQPQAARLAKDGAPTAKPRQVRLARACAKPALNVSILASNSSMTTPRQ